MLISFAKRIAIALLKNSGNEELVALARWLENAEAAAAEKVAQIITASFFKEGKISKGAGEESIKIKRGSGANANTSAVVEAASPSSLIDEYLKLLNIIVKLGSIRRKLLLRGFIDNGNQASLWEFDATPRELMIDELTKGRAIQCFNLGVRIILLPSIPDEQLIGLNEDFGKDECSLAGLINKRDMEEVQRVYQNRITICKTTITEKKFGNRTSDRTKKIDVERVVDTTNFSGIEALVESLPRALAAREKCNNRLKGIIESVEKKESK